MKPLFLLVSIAVLFGSLFCFVLFFSGFMLLATRSGPQGPGKSTPTTEDTCSRRPGVKKVAESVLVGCSLQ